MVKHDLVNSTTTSVGIKSFSVGRLFRRHRSSTLITHCDYTHTMTVATVHNILRVVTFYCLYVSVVLGQEQLQKRIACERQPFKTHCADGKKSQYTIRWFAMGDGCMTYPYGYCPENEVSHVALTMRTRSACEEMCVRNNGSIKAQIIKAQIQEDISRFEFQKPNRTTPELTSFFNYSCTRQEYKKLCAKNVPSQFTFRWHFHDGACFAYPYGHCNAEGDSTPNQLITLRTKEACEVLCNGSRRQNGSNTSTTVQAEFPTLPSWSPNSTQEFQAVKKSEFEVQQFLTRTLASRSTFAESESTVLSSTVAATVIPSHPVTTEQSTTLLTTIPIDEITRRIVPALNTNTSVESEKPDPVNTGPLNNVDNEPLQQIVRTVSTPQSEEYDLFEDTIYASITLPQSSKTFDRLSEVTVRSQFVIDNNQNTNTTTVSTTTRASVSGNKELIINDKDEMFLISASRVNHIRSTIDAESVNEFITKSWRKTFGTSVNWTTVNESAQARNENSSKLSEKIEAFLLKIMKNNSLSNVTYSSTPNDFETPTDHQRRMASVLQLFSKWFNSTLQSSSSNTSVSTEPPNELLDSDSIPVEKRRTFFDSVMEKVCAVINCEERKLITRRRTT